MRRILLALTTVLLGLSFANGQATPSSRYKFDHAEYLQAVASGGKKSAHAVKGSLTFEADKKCVDFLDAKGTPAFSVKYDAISSILYEQTSTPRYAAAIIISPLFLLSREKKHFLTFHYSEVGGASQFAIVRLDKSNAREAVAAAEAQTGTAVERVEEK